MQIDTKYLKEIIKLSFLVELNLEWKGQIRFDDTFIERYLSAEFRTKIYSDIKQELKSVGKSYNVDSLFVIKKDNLSIRLTERDDLLDRPHNVWMQYTI